MALSRSISRAFCASASLTDPRVEGARRIVEKLNLASYAASPIE